MSRAFHVGTPPTKPPVLSLQAVRVSWQVTADGSPLGKAHAVGKAGELVSAFARRFVEGCTIYETEIETLADLLAVALKLGAAAHRLSGTFEEGLHGQVLHARGGDPGATREHLAHRPGPGVICFDIDKGQVVPWRTHDEVAAALRAAIPWLNGVEILVLDSSGSCIALDGDEVRGPGAFHVYALADDATRIPALLEDGHRRCFLAGLGRCVVTAGGAIVERSPVDLALRVPTQPDFMVPHLASPRLTRSRGPSIYPGGRIPAEVALLSAAKVKQAKAIVSGMRDALRPERKRVIGERATEAGQKAHAKLGGNLAQHVAAARRAYETQRLPPTFLVPLGPNRCATVADLCTNPALAGSGWCLPDPLEPEYGDDRRTARLFVDSGQPVIQSFAHGGRKFILEGAPVEPQLPQEDEEQGRASNGSSHTTDEQGWPNVEADGYRSTDGGICRITKAGGGEEPLTNFPARVVASLIEDDGVETRRFLEVEAMHRGRKYRPKLTTADFLAMNWPIEQLGPDAIVYAGNGKKDRAREAIQLLSGQPVVRHSYAHTGWRQIDGAHVYLHSGGAIGTNASLRVETALPEALRNYALPEPSTGEALKEAVRATLRLLELAPLPIIAPLFALIPRAIIGGADFSAWLTGPTGAGKSELAALVQQHFGSAMNSRHLPAAWQSTANANQELAFAAKDAVLTVDDFVASGSGPDAIRLHRDADHLLRGQGNRAGRQRMRADATLRPPRPPRGLVLGTGEDVPRGQSLRGRMVIIQLGANDLRWGKLTACQRDAEAGLYASTTAGFIRWLAARLAGVRDRTGVRSMELRQQIVTGTDHKRTPEITAQLGAALEQFLAFAREVGAIADDRKMWTEWWTALCRSTRSRLHSRPNPIRREGSWSFSGPRSQLERRTSPPKAEDHRTTTQSHGAGARKAPICDRRAHASDG